MGVSAYGLAVWFVCMRFRMDWARPQETAGLLGQELSLRHVPVRRMALPVDLKPYMSRDGNTVDAVPEFYFQVLMVGLRRVQEMPFKDMYEQIYKWLLEVVSGDEFVEVQEFFDNLPEVCKMSKMGVRDVDSLFKNVLAFDDDDEEETFDENGELIERQHTVLVAEMIHWLSRFDGSKG